MKRCLTTLLGLVIIAGLAMPTQTWASFGLTTTTDYYQVDTGAGLVFKIRRNNPTSTTSPGDIMSLVYNGVEYQDQSRGSQVNSGFDWIYTYTNLVSVTPTVYGSNYIKITVVCGDPNNPSQGLLTHYYIVRNGDPNIYMATYFNKEPTGQSLCRYILRLSSSLLPNGPVPSDNRGTDYTVESGDIFGFSPSNSIVALRGQTRSKHYSNMRTKDWSYIGASGSGVGAWMFRDTQEGASGGPFYRCLLNQCGNTDQEITYIVNYGEAQTEPYRLNILNGPYTLVFNDGSVPTAPDTSWISGLGLIGYVGSSGRGTVSGSSISGRDASFDYTVGFANTNAQYWADASASDGSFSCPGMLPGTYTMKVYKGELAVYTGNVNVTAGNTTTVSPITIVDDPSFKVPVWRIGNWDGTPRELLNGDKVTTMHPSDVRMGSWTPGTYVVGSSTPATGMPCYMWKDIGTQTIQFELTASQVVDSVIRVGITTAYSGGRPNISVNSWTSAFQGSSSQPSTRSLTVGSYRGNNTTYTFNVPASALVVGTNTLTVSVISGSGLTGFLSAGYSLDCIDMYQPSAQPVVPSLKASYAFDGNTLDGSGNSNDAIASGSPTYAPGHDGQAIVLNGSSDYLSLPATVADSSDITVATWVYWNGGSNWQRIFDFGTGTSQYLFLSPSSGSGTLRFAIKNGGGEQIVETSPLATGQWVHVAVTLKDNLATLYVNGSAVSSNAAVTINPSDFSPGNNYIGESQFSADPLFNGSIDDFRIYSYALSATDIADLYTTGVIPSDTTAPAAPTGLIAAAGDGSVSLDWADNAEPDLSSYTVYRSTTSGSGYNQIASGLATSSYTDNTAANGTTYYYVVTATDLSTNQSAYSAEASATPQSSVPVPPSAPTGLIATAATIKQVDLSWTAPSGADSYNVKWASASGGPYTTVVSGLAATSYSDIGVLAGTTNYYVVSAVNTVGESADSAEASAVTPELVAYLPFDETSGTTAVDASPNGFDGTLVNGPLWATGLLTNSVLLDGVNDYISLPAGVVGNAGNFTIATWVYLDSNSMWSRIFDFGSGTTTNMFLTPQGSAGVVRFAITTSGGSGEQQIDGAAVLPTNAWTHVAVTRDGNIGILYVDGVAVGTNSTMTLYPAAMGDTTLNYIGKSQYADPYLAGAVDDFRIIGRALSPTEIATLATPPADTTAPAAPTGLVATAGDGSVSLNWADNTEPDLASYTVYRSTTSGSGHSVIASGLTSSAYVDNTVANGTTYYYVVTATDSSSNESAASSEVSATPQAVAATSMHVSSITLGTVSAGHGSKYGQAAVAIVDNLGAPVSGATVSGTFTGSYNETGNAVTDSSGVATLLTSGTAKRGISFTFTVSGVSGSLTYDSNQNVQTSATY